MAFRFKKRTMRRRFPRKPKRKVTKAVKHYVKKALDRNTEDKYLVFQEAAQQVMNADQNNRYTSMIVPIPKGVEQSERIGNVIRVKSVNLKAVFSVITTSPLGVFAPNTAVTPYQFEFKWALCRSLVQGSLPVVPTPASTGFNLADQNSVWISSTQNIVAINQRNYNSFPTIKVLRTGTFLLNFMGGQDDIPPARIVNIRVHFKNPLRIVYNNTSPGSAPADVLKNSLWFTAMSNAPGTDAAQGWVRTTSTITYEDA